MIEYHGFGANKFGDFEKQHGYIVGKMSKTYFDEKG
jgi:hypothetical protein